MAGWIYLMGGETTAGPLASAGITSSYVYDRCDVFNIARNAWNVDSFGAPLPLVNTQVNRGGCPKMPRGMHGIFPIKHPTRDVIYISGGGVRMGHSSSSLVYALT